MLSRRLQQRVMMAQMTIPNEEVKSIYENQFGGWIKEGLGGDDQRRSFLAALLSGDAERVEEHLAR